MKKKITNFFLALMLVFNASITLKAQLPEVSQDGKDVWYFIECMPRDAAKPNAKWLQGAAAGGELSVAELSKADNQRWKVVKNGNGFALVNKAAGTYMDADQSWTGDVATSIITAVAAAPATQIKFTLSKPYAGRVNILDIATVVAADNTVDPATMTFAFYSAGSNINKPIAYTNKDSGPDVNINYSVKFLTEKMILGDAIKTVSDALASSSEGNNPGQFSSESMEGMLSTLEMYQEYYNDPSTTANQFFTYTEELLGVFEMFKEQVNLPEYSTSTNDVWYFIQGTRPENTYMTSLGAGAKIKDSKVIPNETQLWKLVANPTGGFALQNKSTGEYINTDVASGTEFTTQSNLPASGLRFIMSTVTTNKTFRFWIENETNATPALRFHAGGSGNSWNAMNWTGNKDDNCTWLFLSYAEALKANYKLSISDAEAFLAAMVVGNEFGQYAQEVYNDFKTIVDEAKAKDLEEMSEQELIDGVELLAEAQEMLVCNSDVATLQSATPTTTDKWFRLVNAATAEYAKNKAMASTGRNENDKFTFENINVDSDAQLFRFELKEGTASVSAIVNKANKMYVGSDGKILAENPGVDFSVIALDGFSFKIVPAGAAPLHAQQSGSHIVNWESGAGSASAWKFIYVKEASNIELLDNERTITVASANPAKGSAVLTGTTETSITTKNKNISVTATPNKGIFFAGWTNAAGDTISKSNPYVYSGTENITLNANFIDGYYRTMKRFYVAAKPSVQQTNRYLQAASAKVGENTKQIFNDVTTNPNPIDESVTSGQVIGNALLDYTTASIEVPYQTASFDLTCVGRSSEDTEEDLRWTQQITFIDWDQDFNFTGANEKSEKNSEEGNDSTLIDPNGFTRTIAIPAGLAEGYYRMRVVYHEPTSATADWGTSIWSKSEIRNGVAYDFTIKYGTPNSVNRPSASNLKVYVVNYRIHVSGVENFELYNIKGQRLDSKKSVEAGVYLVKAANDVQKVIVK